MDIALHTPTLRDEAGALHTCQDEGALRAQGPLTLASTFGHNCDGACAPRGGGP